MNMREAQMRNALVVMFAILFLVTLPLTAHAAKPGKAVKVTKERLVLMPLHVGEDERNMLASMETALVQGLQQKYEVFSGEQVAQKAREIFLKESRSTAKKECDETRCMQGIAEAFQAELIATANVTKITGGYLLALSIQNIFDNKVVYSNSLPCKNCDPFQVVDKLKELSGSSVQATSQETSPAGNNIEPAIIPGSNPNDPENSLWAEVQKGNSADDYGAYLAQYPKGKYAALATARIAKLKKEASQPVATAPKADKAFRDCQGCPEMVEIPPGNFDMGSNNGSGDEKPVHRVTFVKPFAIGKTEVTQGQWKVIMGNNPSKFSDCGDTCPVELVSWNDAKEFIQKLNAKTGKQYRLPSEAEWEYACRAGGHQKYCGSDNVDSVAWYGSEFGNTHPVAEKQANTFGLYDMSGNVWEWVEDSYHDNYNGAPTDGSAWQGDGAKRVLRGGSWTNNANDSRSSFRLDLDPRNIRGGIGYRNYIGGFRVASTLPE
jgi:formylglycine-generating enzyme required for sulfatase activity